MVKFIAGDIFTSTQPALGHGVNIIGVMGSGIAPLIRKRHPKVFAPYKEACDAQTLVAGGMLPVETEPGFWVLNLASQDNPGRNARLEWLMESLERAFMFVVKNNLSGFAIPRIGAGVGGLEWADAKNAIERVASGYPDVTLEVWILPHEIDMNVDTKLVNPDEFQLI